MFLDILIHLTCFNMLRKRFRLNMIFGKPRGASRLAPLQILRISHEPLDFNIWLMFTAPTWGFCIALLFTRFPLNHPPLLTAGGAAAPQTPKTRQSVHNVTEPHRTSPNIPEAPNLRPAEQRYITYQAVDSGSYFVSFPLRLHFKSQQF